MKGKRKGRLDWGIGGIDGEVATMGFVFSVVVVFHELPDEQHPKYDLQVGWQWCACRIKLELKGGDHSTKCLMD